MGKILIGVVTAAAWFILSHAANAERVCQQVCDNGTCLTKCVGADAATAVDQNGASGVTVQTPGVTIDTDR